MSPKQKERNTPPISGDHAPPSSELVPGLVVGGSRGFYDVDTDAGTLTCTIRGRLRKQLIYGEGTSGFNSVRRIRVQQRDPVAAGDRVRVRPTGESTGVIEEIAEREGSFSRQDPAGGPATQTSVAGLDQLVCVVAAHRPEPHVRLLDRLLVIAELQEIAGAVCLNKIDLGVEPRLEARLEAYREAGYPVIYTSVAEHRGIDALREQLAGRTSAFIGPSGVGKTSLLNTVRPESAEPVAEVSTATNKGRHTTVGTRLYPLTDPRGGHVADTAGIRALGLPADATERLDWCFPEFREYLGECKLSDCTHLREAGCAVRSAERSGAIDHERYDSYCRLRREGTGGLQRAWREAE